MQHQKHNKLAKPACGQFGRQEWAILGTPCVNIQAFARALAEQLAPHFRTAYIDADHKSADEADSTPAFVLEYTDKIQFQRFDFVEKPNAWQQRALFNETDLVLVNGNHFPAARQIVVLDRRKFESLTRKMDRLTRVDLFLTDASDEHFTLATELPDTLKEHLPGWANIPVLNLRDTAGVASFLESQLTPPPVHALILTGGKSTRMGQDKSALDYHGMPQWQYLRNLLHSQGIPKVYLSCRVEQAAGFAPEPVVTDTFLDLGPMGAILSAFRHNPNAAWLVLACDLPFLDADTIRYLLDNRQPSAVATAFRQPPPPPGSEEIKDSGFPEPLVAIWEPASYLGLLQFLAQGVSCPRKVLINSRTHLLDAPRPEALLNVNTPEERARVLEMLRSTIVD